jgi:hypothetical protein
MRNMYSLYEVLVPLSWLTRLKQILNQFSMICKMDPQWKTKTKNPQANELLERSPWVFPIQTYQYQPALLKSMPIAAQCKQPISYELKHYSIITSIPTITL